MSLWFTIEPIPEKKATYRIKVKWWHPAFWWYGFRTLRRSGASFWEAFRFTVVLVRQFKK